MADNPTNSTFIPAPSGLAIDITNALSGGRTETLRLPIVAFRVDGEGLVPYYAERDGSIGSIHVLTTLSFTADWIDKR